VKIKVTYEEADLKQLIRLDLARQGIAATDADISLTKGKAEIAVEVTRDDAELAAELPAAPDGLTAEQRSSHTHDVGRSTELPPAPPPQKEPPLQVVEGGNNPIDMSDVLGASNRIARQSPGKFPVPERSLMEGESFDFPGDK
jgi:hypothetical protein